MKVRLFLTTDGLERVAKGELPSSLDAFCEGLFYFDQPGNNRTLVAEIDVALPSRDAAVQQAATQLLQQRAELTHYFDKRIAALQALTWEPPTA